MKIARSCSVGFVDLGYIYGSVTDLTEVPGTGMT